ncbi:MAG: DUF3142 domain-containing protein [Xanthomonadaceae bacterium]|jgi:hypothetical protein|nr:DUF3142 domain-containing protein [Xanthomonadaceae bacterium]
MPNFLLRLIWMALLSCVLCACVREPARLDHDAYIWQRVWTPALNDALRQGTADIRQWRVLAAQTGADGALLRFVPDWEALAASGRPVIVVARIDGQLRQWDEDALLAEVLDLWRDWQGHRPLVAGLEIDHDCGTARLPVYAHFLRRLKSELDADTELSITVLPAWLDSPALENVLAAVDQSVLQVHAVRDPRAGLFDGGNARRWVEAYARRSDKPFRVALPNYASRASWDAEGQLADVESEAATLGGQADARELWSQPRQIAEFLSILHADPPRHLRGIAWFRLPTGNDRRAWSVATWLAVIRGQPMRDNVALDFRQSDTAGMRDLVLTNAGENDAMLPERIGLPAACTLADGIQGYALRREADALSLRRQQPGLLRPGQSRQVGWARCGED